MKKLKNVTSESEKTVNVEGYEIPLNDVAIHGESFDGGGGDILKVYRHPYLVSGSSQLCLVRMVSYILGMGVIK